MIPEPVLNLDYLHSRALLLPSYESIHLHLIGCGGTGSWLAPSVARIGRLLIEKLQKSVSIYFHDPDVVEEKNCYRQNFCAAEIGRNKAETLAFRYGLAWGMEIAAVPYRFTGKLPSALDAYRLVIMIGCVDNPDGRRAIEKAAPSDHMRSSRFWWLDCGNHQSAGQVLLGCGGSRAEDQWALPDHCSWLPLPTVYHPDLVADPEPGEARAVNTENLSCADLAMLDQQGLAINQSIAAEATDYLVRLLLTRDLRKRATYIDLASGVTRSKYIVPEEG